MSKSISYSILVNRASFLCEQLKKCIKVHEENKSEAWGYWAEFSESKMWVLLDYKSAEEFAEKELKKSYSWLHRMVQAADVQKTIPNVEIPNEATAREIGKISSIPERKKIVSAALEANEGKLSAPAIKKAVASLPERKKQALSQAATAVRKNNLPKDGTGLEIPPEIQEFWNRNEEVNHLLSMVSKIKTTLEKARETKDPLFCKMDAQRVISNMIQSYQEIESAKSYAVCPKCNGIMFESCKGDGSCNGRGTLSKFHWDNFVPDAIKKLRET